MTMPALDHGGLLTLVRKAHAAAGDADIKRLNDDLETFVHALAAHLDNEMLLLTRVPPGEARILRRGQARVSAAARALLHEATGSAADVPGRCAAHTEQLLALLALQARDERLALHGVYPGPGGGHEDRARHYHARH